MPFLATLASMSFFKRSCTYNLDCFGRVWNKNDVKTASKYGNICCLYKHLIVFLIITIRISFLLPFLQSVIRFCTLKSENDIFICLGERRFLGYKVGKVFFFLRFVFDYSVNNRACSTAICSISLVTLFLKSTKSNC